MNGEARETGNFAPETHELLSYAATQLFAQNQKSLELRDSHGSDHPSIKDTPEGAVSNGQGDTPRPLGGTVLAGPGYSYAHASRTRFGDQQSDPSRKKQIQVNYLDCLAARIPAPSSFHDELQTKEKLRVQLTTIAQKALERYAHDNGHTIGPRAIDLKCFGSLRNGFMLPNADLDLVMKTHASSFPRELEKVCPHVLEKAFLDAGFGARLLSNTRVPIIKLCEKPPKQFLGTLKQEHARRQTKEAQRLSGTKIGSQSDLSAPPNTLHSCRRRASFDFPQSSVGLRCEINFSGRLALYNTELLRCYALCDERVRFLGVFVKMWAKNRKINDPHDGTLCSYGYILMVVHYLMNVAYPPVVPNLQAIQRSFPGHVEVASVNGYDVRFFNDENELRAMSERKGPSGNTQSVGELLRGFFAYYGSQGNSSPQNFHWVNSTISIRTPGGILPKYEKGWNTARTDDNGNRLRFLIAIEDPFEHNHNVARTVTENGLSAIRSEFRRAQTIVTRVQEIPGIGWEWRTDEGDVGQDFLAEARCQPKWRPARPSKTLQRHLDCVPELCTAQAESGPVQGSTQNSQNSDGHAVTKSGLSSNHVRRKPIHTEKPARRDASNELYPDQKGHSGYLPVDERIQGSDGHAKTKYDVPAQPTSASPVCGIILDTRQFYSPGAIRDRHAVYNGHIPPSHGPEYSRPINSDTDSAFTGTLLGIPRAELLANLPFYE